MMLSREKGFTLIELMIVVAIIGILAAIAIPNFLNLKDKATWGTTKANLDVLRSSLASYAANLEQNKFPVGTLAYAALMPLLPMANLPATMQTAKINSMSYTSTDGSDFTISATSTNRYNDALTANPRGITPSSYSH